MSAGGSSAGTEPGETVSAVMTDLADVAEMLPVSADRAEATARILDRLAGEISEAAGMLRGAALSLPRIDGSVHAGDERLTRARMPLAEQHEPLVMTPGDLRQLLARYRQRVTGLIAAAEGAGA
jgi:hypothetical protein